MNSMNSTDLATLNPAAKADAGVEFEVVHPVTGDPMGVFIKILGVESDVAQELLSDRVAKGQRSYRKTGQLPTDSLAAQRAQRIDFCVACTKDWRGLTFEGADLPFSTANARKVYTALLWLVKQVDEQIANLENFI